MRPAEQLTVTFNVNWPMLIEKLGPTLVTYEIEQAGEAVKLTMSEVARPPASDDILSGGRQGWPAILSSLKSVLETGKPLVGEDGPAATDAGGAEGVGDCDAVILVHPSCAGLARASIEKVLRRADGLPGQARQRRAIPTPP